MDQTWLVMQLAGSPMLVGMEVTNEDAVTYGHGGALLTNKPQDIAYAYINAPTWDDACTRFVELFWRHEDSGVYFAEGA